MHTKNSGLNLKQMKTKRLWFVTALVILSALLYVAWKNSDLLKMSDLADQAESFRLYLQAHPSALILSLAILPGLGAPVSPLLILFGVIMGPKYGLPTTCLIGVTAQAICSCWSYFLAAGPLRNFLSRTLLRKRTLPALTPNNSIKICFMVRMTPGFPYALQNVVLGVLKMPFIPYLIVSIPVQSIYTITFITTGGAFFEGHTGRALSAFLLLIAAVLGLRWIHKKRAQANG